MAELIGICGLGLISYALWQYFGAEAVCLFVGIVLVLVGLFMQPGKPRDGS